MSGAVAADGSINVTVVDGSTWTGAAAADGSYNIIQAPGGVWVGAAHPCGAFYVTLTASPVNFIAAPDGSMYVSVSPYQTGTRQVTVVSGSLGAEEGEAGAQLGLWLWMHQAVA